MSVQSNYKTTVSVTLGDAATDLNIYLDILPANDTGELVLDPEGTNYELIYYESKTVVSGTSGYVTCPASNGRGLSLTAATRTGVAANRKIHGPGTKVIQAPDHILLNDKGSQSGNNTWSGTNAYTGTVIYSGSLRVPVYADATARDTAIPSPSNGMVIYNTDVGLFQKYQAGSWIDDTSGASTPNASTTVAGKTERATYAEVAAGTELGGTGAALFMNPADFITFFTTNVTDYFNNNSTATSSGVGDAGKYILLNGDGEIDPTLITAAKATDVAYVAGENLSLGDIAAKNDIDDEVIKAIINRLNNPGTEVTFSTDAAAKGFIKAVGMEDNTVAILFADTTGTDTLKLVIATVDSAKAITFGTPVTVETDTSFATCEISYFGDNLLGIVFEDASTLKVKLASVSGTVPTLGSAATISTSITYTSICRVDTSTLLVVYRDESDSGKGKAAASLFSGTTITGFGTPTEFESGSTYYTSVDRSQNGYAIVCYQDNGDTDDGKACLLQVSGNSVNAGTPVAFDTNAVYYLKTRRLEDGKLLVTYYKTTGTACMGVVLDADTFTITPGTPVSLATGIAGQVGLDVLTSTSAVTTFEDSGNLAKVVIITISGSTVVGGSVITANNGANTTWPVVARVTDEKFLVAYSDDADSNKGNAEVYWDVDNSDEVVGFVVADANDGAAVNIRKIGKITNPSWTLVPGTTYYLSDDATGLSVVNTTGIKMGIAYDTTTLDIDIDREETFYNVGPGRRASAHPVTAQMPMVSSLFTASAGTITEFGTWMQHTHTSDANVRTDGPILPGKIGAGNISGTFSSLFFTKLIVEWFQYFSTYTATNGLGFGLISDVASLIDFDNITDACSFAISADGNTLYAHTANGSAHTEVEIAGISLAEINLFRIELEPGVAARFYINGELKTTITSTLPNSGTAYWGTGIDANGVSSFGQLVVSAE